MYSGYAAAIELIDDYSNSNCVAWKQGFSPLRKFEKLGTYLILKTTEGQIWNFLKLGIVFHIYDSHIHTLHSPVPVPTYPCDIR